MKTKERNPELKKRSGATLKALLLHATNCCNDPSVENHYIDEFHNMLKSLESNSIGEYNNLSEFKLPENQKIDGKLFLYHVNKFDAYFDKVYSIFDLEYPTVQIRQFILLKTVHWIKENLGKILKIFSRS